jgi:hypothetical protein
VAQKATPDDGVAHSYDVRQRAWNASYPETTGYVIPTLYDYAHLYNAPEYAEAARRMAIWESEIQMEDGGVRAGTMSAEIVAPTIFNTGQVLFGWAKAWLETRDERFKSSLIRASDWLVDGPGRGWRVAPFRLAVRHLEAEQLQHPLGLRPGARLRSAGRGTLAGGGGEERRLGGRPRLRQRLAAG